MSLLKAHAFRKSEVKVYRFIYKTIYSSLNLYWRFYGPPDGSQRAIMFLPCPSARPSAHGGQNCFCLKTRFMGF